MQRFVPKWNATFQHEASAMHSVTRSVQMALLVEIKRSVWVASVSRAHQHPMLKVGISIS